MAVIETQHTLKAFMTLECPLIDQSNARLGSFVHFEQPYSVRQVKSLVRHERYLKFATNGLGIAPQRA